MQKQDLAGRTYGRWLVLDRSEWRPSAAGGSTFWLCRCNGCGEEKWVAARNLKSGHSAGCVGCHISRPDTKLIDLKGRSFGQWVVLRAATKRGKNRKWVCECRCGAIVEVAGHSLRSGASTQCRWCSRNAPTGVPRPRRPN